MHLPTGVAHFVQQSSAHSYTIAAYMYFTTFLFFNGEGGGGPDRGQEKTSLT